MDSLSAQAEPAPAPATEPDMTPFSLADLGLSDDEIAALESAGGPAARCTILRDLASAPSNVAANCCG